MISAVVYLDRQHSGKPGRPNDRGAAVDLDGDGKIQRDEQEAALTARYLLACELALLEMGPTVIPISVGAGVGQPYRSTTATGGAGIERGEMRGGTSGQLDPEHVRHDQWSDPADRALS